MIHVMFSEAATRVRRGEIGVVPTDTLYGLVASALDSDAVERVYRVRGRDTGKPCIVLLSDTSELGRFGIDMGDMERRLLSSVWPGAVSVVLPCPDPRWAHLHRETGTIAFRVPADAELRGFLVAAGPVIAPSANPAGEMPAETIREAETYFGDRIDFLVDGGTLRNASSTVVDIGDGAFRILRQGGVIIE